MANRNTLLGGTDFTNEIILSQDMYDTFKAVVDLVTLDKKFNIAATYTTLPVGTILFWAKSIAGVPQTLPTGWYECDGTNGTPNLNSTNTFLRGTSSETTGTTGGSTTHTHSQLITTGQATGVISYYVNISTDSNVPPYYDFVYIIKVS